MITKLSNTECLYITGCDKNTEWMLPWFLQNFRFHNNEPILFMDFGCSLHMAKWARDNFDYYDVLRDDYRSKVGGWNNKPKAMCQTSDVSIFRNMGYEKFCWLDTDVQIVKNTDSIFDYATSGKISMVCDKPWTKRTGEKWFNSGVVVWKKYPNILEDWWMYMVKVDHTIRGDQEALHEFLSRSGRKNVIREMDNKYNYLRLQHQDGDVVNDIRAYHWTGLKGKQIILDMIERNA